MLGEVDQARDDGLTRAQITIDRWATTTLAASGVGLLLAGPVAAVAVVYSGIGYALRYAGPIALLNYMRLAMRQGVLVRDGRTFERLVDVDTVVFDKTGTLTCETPTVTRVIPLGSWNVQQILQWAATAESHQSHPIAHAIRQAAKYEPASDTLSHTAVKPGLGLDMLIEGRRIIIGSTRLLQAEGIELENVPDELSTDDSILIHMAIDGVHAGIIQMDVQTRSEAPEVIRTLQQQGLEVMVLSGDRDSVTKALADELELDGYFADVMPQQKAEIIKQLQEQGHTVCFVGDGINDALALSVADVSVSFAGAAPIAESAASVVLMQPDLLHILCLLELSRSNARNFKRSSKISTVGGIVCVGGVIGLGAGLGFAMAFYNISLATCMANATLPLLKGRKNRAEQPNHPQATGE